MKKLLTLIVLVVSIMGCKKDTPTPIKYSYWNFNITEYAVKNSYPYDTIKGVFFSDRPKYFIRTNIDSAEALKICDSATMYQKPPEYPYDNSNFSELFKICEFIVYY